MRAVWLENQILSYRDDVPQPEPLAGEALVKVHLAGICGTDLELVKGYYPFNGIPGHEFVGEIVKAPAEPHREGQRVVGEINITCGRCPADGAPPVWREGPPTVKSGPYRVLKTATVHSPITCACP
jgi:threonine dehydrogenase-like Zn-dependent dehydrogenase